MFTQYAIKSNSSFNENVYPRVIGEIDGLQKSLRDIRSQQKSAIVISLLKDHCIKTELLDRNRQLVTILTSGFLRTSHVESLFNSCKGNLTFEAGLEAYITTKLA